MIVHLYWHENADVLQRSARRWRDVMPEADVWLTTAGRGSAYGPSDDDVVERIEQSCHTIDERDRVRHRANCTRWWLLSTYGGVWADVDVVPLRSFPEIATPWCAAIDGVPTPFVCGGAADAPVWAKALDEALSSGETSSPAASGGRALARVEGAALTLLPAGWFAERDALGRSLRPPPGGRFSDHAWATSRHRRHERTS